MSAQTIFATEHHPLVVLTKNSKTHHCFTKYWHDVTVQIPHSRKEQIFISTCNIPKLSTSNSESLAKLLAMPVIEQHWSPPATLFQTQVVVVALQYSPSTKCVTHPHIIRSNKSFTPAEIEDNYKFALNPSHLFNNEQAQAIDYILNGGSTRDPRLPDPKELTQFRSMWLTGTPPPIPPQAIFPTTIHEAIRASTTKSISAVTILPPEKLPTLYFVNPQPTFSKAVPIPNISLQNLHKPTCKLLPPATLEIYLSVSPQSLRNSRREVFYAKPTIPTASNPTCEPFPCSPLKSTIALLFCDTNQLSPTYGQPIFKSINLHKAQPEEIEEFLLSHRTNLNPSQLAAITGQTEETEATAIHQPTHQPQIMSHPIPCAHCETLFQPTRSTSKFCSSTCREQSVSQSRRKYPIAGAENLSNRAAPVPRIPPVAAAIPSYAICFPDGLYYIGPEYTQNAIVHDTDASHRVKSYHAKRYTQEEAKAILSNFPACFVDCTVELVVN